MAIFTDDGIDLSAQLALGITTSVSLVVHLYSNNYTPSLTSETSSFTESTAAGYEAAELHPTYWTGGTSDGLAVYTYPTLTFTFTEYTGDEVYIYGYYIEDSVSGDTIWAELFSTSYEIPLSGGQLQLNLTYNSANCSA